MSDMSRWFREEESNLQLPGSEPGLLPIEVSLRVGGRLGVEPKFPDSQTGVLTVAPTSTCDIESEEWF